jgi:hypothetical protein
MTFDVTKFLALTAVLAGASVGAAACSSNSNDDTGNGGSSGSSGSDAGGDSNSAAGSSAYAGERNGLGGEGGALGVAGGAHEGGAALCAAGGPSTSCNDTGGASTGGTGAGGEGGAESCLADAAFEGDPCADILDTKCDGAEENFYNPFYDLCWASGGTNMTVRLAFVACLEGDECAETAAASAQACWATAAAKACPKEGAAAACTTMLGTCTDGGLNAADCEKMLNNYTDALDYVPECLDPNAEGFDDAFVGDCKERLARCIGVPAF